MRTISKGVGQWVVTVVMRSGSINASYVMEHRGVKRNAANQLLSRMRRKGLLRSANDLRDGEYAPGPSLTSARFPLATLSARR